MSPDGDPIAGSHQVEHRGDDEAVPKAMASIETGPDVPAKPARWDPLRGLGVPEYSCGRIALAEEDSCAIELPKQYALLRIPFGGDSDDGHQRVPL